MLGPGARITHVDTGNNFLSNNPASHPGEAPIQPYRSEEMSHRLDESIKDLNEALAKIKEDSLAEARESVLSDPKALMKDLFDDDMYLGVSGIGYRGPKDISPLTCYLRSLDFGTLFTLDPVADVIRVIADDRLDAEETGEMIDRSIATLQSGIDRLKAFQAERESKK